jgi:hypothetical protein
MSASVSSHSNSSSPERKCLGGLMKDIEDDYPKEDSKDETAYKTLSEQKLSLDSIYPYEKVENKLNKSYY